MPDPIPTFSELAVQIGKRFPDFAYLHVVEPRYVVNEEEALPIGSESNDEIRVAWGERPYLAGGGYDLPGALTTAQNKGGLIVFGRQFIANVSYGGSS